ncbi:MAG: STAS domain-containing protein [Planctomycetes bacterium]|nr:STAS domain-containing protein [Planctomycetota bacterium]
MRNTPECRIVDSHALDVPHAWFFQLEGWVDLGESLDVVKSTIRNRIDEGYHWIVLDVAAVQSFGELGFQPMIILNELVLERRGRVVFVGMPRHCRDSYELLPTGDVEAAQFGFAGDQETAVRHIGLIERLARRGWKLNFEPGLDGAQSEQPGNPVLKLTAFTIADRPDYLVVEFDGRLSAPQVIFFESWVRQRRDEGYVHFFWEAGRVKAMTSIGEASFIAVADDVQRSGGSWSICNVSRAWRPVFDMLGYSRYFPEFESIEAALDHVSAPADESKRWQKVYGRDLPRTVTHVEPGGLDDSLVIAVDQQGILGAPFESEFNAIFAEHGVPRWLIVDGAGIDSVASSFHGALSRTAAKGGTVVFYGIREPFAEQRQYWRMFETRADAEAHLRSLHDDDIVVYARRLPWIRAVHVVLRGDLLEPRTPRVRAAILALLEPEDSFIILEPAGTRAVDRANVENLAAMSRLMMENGGCVMVAGATPEFRQAFKNAESVFEWYDNAEAAQRSAAEIIGFRNTLVQGVEETGIDGCKRIRLAGRMGLGPALDDFERQCNDVFKAGVRDLVLDLSEVQTLDDLGTLSLAAVAKACRDRGGSLVLIAVPRKLQTWLEFDSKCRQLPRLPDLKSALSWIRRKREEA